MLTYENLPAHTRVWIYQAERPFTTEELAKVQQHLSQFTAQWVSHNRALQAFSKVFHQQFIVLLVDESQAGASGCSIDSSVQFLQCLSADLNIDFFNRMLFAYQENGMVKTVTRDEFAKLYEAGQLTDSTLVFDNLVATKADLETNWIKPLAQSWHRRLV